MDCETTPFDHARLVHNINSSSVATSSVILLLSLFSIMTLACMDSLLRRRRRAALKAARAASRSGEVGRIIKKDGYPYFKVGSSPTKKCKKRRRSAGQASYKISKITSKERVERRRNRVALDLGYVSSDSTNSKKYPMYDPVTDS